jgi:hypothetical protein
MRYGKCAVVNKSTGSAPLWAWLLGLLPWVWIIPFNQYFWDDWIFSATTNFGWHFEYWVTNGAKHWANPMIYPTLIRFGAWSFALLTVGFMVISSAALRVIVNKCPPPVNSSSRWAGPLLLVLPVFHARFSAAVFEYFVCLATLLVGWSLLVSPRLKQQFAGIIALIFAVGVPSLAILYPVIYVHRTWLDVHRESRIVVGRILRNLYILLIPMVYSVIFSRVISTKGKYAPSIGALVEFGRALGVLLVLLSLLLVVVSRFRRQEFKNWLVVSGLAILAYFGLFPYFAVGYNPLSDFLPWRMRREILDQATARMTIALALLLLVGIMGVTLFGSRNGQAARMLSAPLLFAVLFSSTTIVFGPMDWESRHWLIAWPVLTVLFLALAATVQIESFEPIVRSVFLVFLAASIAISSEYLVDSLKQKAIVAAAANELKSKALAISEKESRYVIVVDSRSTAQALNARYRSYRPYEWWGLMAQGLGLDPEFLKIMEMGDFDQQKKIACNSPYRATVVTPRVLTSRFEALTRLRVKIDLDPQPIEICSLRVSQGYPRG